MRIRLEGFGPLRRPLDRPIDLLRGPRDNDILRVEEDLGAKCATDIGSHDAHLVLGESQHKGGHEQTLDVRVLVRDVEQVAILAAIVVADRRTRLDCIGHQPVIDDLERRDVRCLRECLIDCCLVAECPNVAGVVRRDVVENRRAALARISKLSDGRQDVIVDVHQLRGILRLSQRLGDHHGNVVADIAHTPLREDRVRRLLHRLAVHVGDQPAARESINLCRGDVFASEDRDDARCFESFILADRFDTRVRMRRADEVGAGFARELDVVGVLSAAGEKAVVLAPFYRLPDVVCGHGALSSRLDLRRGRFDGFDDVVIAGAAAQIAVEPRRGSSPRTDWDGSSGDRLRS